MRQKANQCWKLKKDRNSLRLYTLEICVDEVFQQVFLYRNAKGQSEGRKDNFQKTNQGSKRC
jgi:hypothetical protein